MSKSWPNPDHRSTRLATQASMLYVILYFAPDILINQKTTMREIVDKHFNDNWVLSKYMGQLVDLTVEWATYPAAKSALENILNAEFVKGLDDKNKVMIKRCLEELKGFLKEGVLVQDYVLDNIKGLLECVRGCNICLRWRLLHIQTSSEVYRKIIANSVPAQIITTLLLNTAQIEYTLKGILEQLLNEKDHAWTDGKDSAAKRMYELSEYFTGDKALSHVKRDENMMRWFISLADQVNSLNLDEEHATSTGRKIQGLIAALEDVEQFKVVDNNLQMKSFLNEIRDIFRQMIRTVNIKHEVLHVLENVSDFSYAFVIMNNYLQVLHDRIKLDPMSVVLLRAVFLKMASVLDIPLVRITSIVSPDAESVAEYYSTELVDFVRLVLAVIPVSVFQILSDIEKIQTHKMVTIPIRFEAKDLKDFAQTDLRVELSKLTHQVSIFTEGILVMEKTLLGVIQVEPRSILEEGLRRELVRLVATAMDSALTFSTCTSAEIIQKMTSISATLDGLKRSIEYLQDYIDIAGLKIYQQEMARVINYNTEQEANKYLQKKTFDSNSRYQSRSIPIPRLISTGLSKVPANSRQAAAIVPVEKLEADITFMGRIMNALCQITSGTNTVYAPECLAWFSHAAADEKKPFATVEVCGIRTFSLLERSIGTIGLRGLDKLFAFRAVFILNGFLKFYSSGVSKYIQLLSQVRDALYPEAVIASNAKLVYGNALKKMEPLMAPLLKIVRTLGQIQLIRRQIANLLQFNCRMEADMLYQALDTFNSGLLNEISKHYARPEKHPYPSQAANPIMMETACLLESCGMDDPLHKVYITSQPLEGVPVLLFLFLVTYLPKLEYDGNFGSLVRKKSSTLLDGVPLVVGVACLLKQFHQSVTRHVIMYLGQYVRTAIQTVFGSSEADAKAVEVPTEIVNILIFCNQLCQYTSIPRTVVYAFIPPYIFDAVKLNTSTTKQESSMFTEGERNFFS